jgi:hypothetical protein
MCIEVSSREKYENVIKLIKNEKKLIVSFRNRKFYVSTCTELSLLLIEA